jgi:hypothetical protein
MRNFILFGAVSLVIAASLFIGVQRYNAAKSALSFHDADARRQDGAHSATRNAALKSAHDTAQTATRIQTQPQPQTPSAASIQRSVPHIGSVQVLNGCGAEGAANRMADFLRSKSFDVKDIGNAPTWNHPATMVISRTADMGLANEIERFLKTGKVVLIRNGELLYDVTVVAGPDFEDRIK